MKYRIKTFGVTREIIGDREKVIETNGQTVAELRKTLHQQYPELTGLRSLLIAVNNEYAEDTTELQESDEIGLIPPVSGG